MAAVSVVCSGWDFQSQSEIGKWKELRVEGLGTRIWSGAYLSMIDVANCADVKMRLRALECLCEGAARCWQDSGGAGCTSCLDKVWQSEHCDGEDHKLCGRCRLEATQIRSMTKPLWRRDWQRSTKLVHTNGRSVDPDDASPWGRRRFPRLFLEAPLFSAIVHPSFQIFSEYKLTVHTLLTPPR